MLQMIKSMRMLDCLLLVGVACISFRYTHTPYNILDLIGLFSVTTSTMLQNDWRDRIHDRAKGKLVASERPTLYLWWLSISWILSALLVAYIFTQHPESGVLLGLAAIVGAFYSEAREIQLLPVTLVTLTVAGSTLFPLTLGVPFIKIAPLFFSVGFIMFGRETLHDIADIEVDKNYKKTIPIVCGDRFARIVSTIGLIIGCVVLLVISPYTLLGSTLIIWALLDVFKETKLVEVRKKIDFGFLVLIVGLFL